MKTSQNNHFPQNKRIDDPNDPDRGAPCGFCWEMLFAYCPDCRICRLRPFGSAPCLNDMPEYQECPGASHCPNGETCIHVSKIEWPLAEVAIKLKESGVV